MPSSFLKYNSYAEKHHAVERTVCIGLEHELKPEQQIIKAADDNPTLTSKVEQKLPHHSSTINERCS